MLAILLFSFALFCSAFLLFVIQPMSAKAILPVYGGSPGVWTICMLYFQLLLWLSYGYSWLLSKIKQAYIWRLVHTIFFIISFSAIPLTMTHLSPGLNPEFAILGDLLKHLSLPLLIIASSAPLIQYAYSQTTLKHATDPYFLYAASNAGSFLALLLYPLLIERFSTLDIQFWIWNVGYVLYFICLSLCLFAIPQSVNTQVQPSQLKAIPLKKVAYWLMLSFIPCSLMLGVTLYVTSDIAATPLLWIIPLALYLLSFIITFQSKPWVKPRSLGRYLLLIIFFPLLIIFGGPDFFKTWQLIIFHFFAYFALALYCHGRLYQSRPPVRHLTLFYFCIATGGVLAGIFNGILAPKLFSDAYEYPLILILTFAFLNLKAKRFDWVCPVFVIIVLITDHFARVVTSYQPIANYRVICLILLAALFIWQPRRMYMIVSLLFIAAFNLVIPNNGDLILSKQRNFFGIKKIVKSGEMHILFNHTTVHGFQVMSLKQQNGLQSYYGGISRVIDDFHREKESLKATILGLGTGMMACQFNRQDQLTYIDIDPQVIAIANDSRYFSFLRDCAPHIRTILGDGRLKLKNTSQHSQDMIILDAFNSDAIPIHLLTLEAVQQFRSLLSEDGIMLIHISNRHINLLPVLTAIGRQLNLIVLHEQHPGDLPNYQLSSEWVLLTSNEEFAQTTLNDPYWHFVISSDKILWQDKYSSIISVLK